MAEPLRPGPGGRASALPATLERLAAVGLLVVILTATFAQVVARFVFDSPFFWTEELARYCYVWLSFLGAVVVTASRTHIAVELFEQRLGRLPRLVLNCFGLVAVIVTCAALAIGSWTALLGLTGSSPALGIPTVVLYGVVYGSFVAMALHAAANLVDIIRSHDAGSRLDEEHASALSI